MSLSLPQDLSNGTYTRTAATPAEYWDLVYRGFKAVESDEESDLSPQQKAARTRAANKALEEEKTSNDGDVTDTAGNATGDES